MPSQLPSEGRAAIAEYAKRLFVSMGLAMPALDTGITGVLNQRLSDSTVRWGLALVIAIWRLSLDSPKGGYDRELIQAGGQKILDDLQRVSSFFPDSFRQFITKTLNAQKQSELAGCAVYFRAGVSDLAQAGYLYPLTRWLSSDAFREVGQRLIRDYPEPGSERPPEKVERAASLTRGERFDRGDFEARNRPRSASTPVDLGAAKKA